MSNYKIEVIEQEPTASGSIFCEVQISTKDDNGKVVVGLRYNHMYFVADANKKITQCFNWIFEYKEQLKDLGYTLPND